MPDFPCYRRLCSQFVLVLGSLVVASNFSVQAASEDAPPPKIRIARLVATQAVYRTNPTALPSLLKEIQKTTTLNVDEQPIIVQSFEDPAIFACPFIYVNFGDREDWTFSELEIINLRTYLDGGGFIHVDAGITAEFLRGNRAFGQQHSFGDWQASKALAKAFQAVYPGKEFQPLPRSHSLYRSFHKGLPNPDNLPETVRDFVVQEKWPEGTYSAVALEVEEHIAVLATPIISMGWGKNINGGWGNKISFRIREGTAGMNTRLGNASYGGERFETSREDGLKDVIFCQEPAKPAWVAEPGGNYRLFRYYHSAEISDFAHEFFTRLGVNIVVYAATE